MTEAFEPERVVVDCFLLADAAQSTAGKINLLGGGWNLLNLGGPDANVPSLALAIRIVVPWTETNQPLGFEIQLVDADGNGLLGEPPRIDLNVGRPPDLVPGTEQAIPLAMTFHNLVFQREGTYAFTISGVGGELNRARFHVRFAQRQPPPQSPQSSP